MVFEWKMKGLYPVAAQAAGMELERIYKDHGRCDAADVVDESRPEEAVLHPCFEWRDHVAAEFYRQQQARNLACIRSMACEGPVPQRPEDMCQPQRNLGRCQRKSPTGQAGTGVREDL